MAGREKELYLIVDEAHHSTAKTYRRIIDYVMSNVPCVKLIGLTATPFRTAEGEQGLLAKIYSDDIVYQIDWESIQRLDTLPDDLAEQIAVSAVRNKLIVDTYLAKRGEYGQTIVFAVNVVHAIQLSALFKKATVPADYIVFDIPDADEPVRI